MTKVNSRVAVFPTGMGTAPTTQAFNVVWPTNMPASVYVPAYGTVVVADVFNSIAGYTYDGLVGDILTLQQFVGAGVPNLTSVTVRNSTWITYNNSAALQFTLYTVSDPVTVTEIAQALGLLAVVMGVLITAMVALNLVKVSLTIAALVIVLGTIVFLTATVAEAAPILTAAFDWLIIAGGVALAIGGGAFAYDFFKERDFRKETYRAAGSVASHVAGEAGRIGARAAGAGTRGLFKLATKKKKVTARARPRSRAPRDKEARARSEEP